MANNEPPLDSDKIRISYNEVVTSTDNAVLLDVDGDEHWFPKSQITLHEDHKLVDIVEWKYKQAFE